MATPDCASPNYAVAIGYGALCCLGLFAGLFMFRAFQAAKYEVANARRLYLDPSQTVIQGQVQSVEITKDKDSGDTFYQTTYEYIPISSPQNKTDDADPLSAAQVRVQRTFTSPTRQYDAGQQLNVQILPTDPMSGRVAQELAKSEIFGEACCVPFYGLCAFGCGSMGFWLFLVDVLQDGCRNQAVVLLFVTYVLGPVLVALVLCSRGLRLKDFFKGRIGTTLIVVEQQENHEEELADIGSGSGGDTA